MRAAGIIRENGHPTLAPYGLKNPKLVATQKRSPRALHLRRPPSVVSGVFSLTMGGDDVELFAQGGSVRGVRRRDS